MLEPAQLTPRIRHVHPVNGGIQPDKRALPPQLLAQPVITGTRRLICVNPAVPLDIVAIMRAITEKRPLVVRVIAAAELLILHIQPPLLAVPVTFGILQPACVNLPVPPLNTGMARLV